MKPYYQHAGITIYHRDCREIMPLCEAGCIVSDPPYGCGKKYGSGSVDNIATFQWAVEMIADRGLPASICMPVSRLFDLPRRPQWVGAWTKRMSMSGLIAYPIYPHWEPIAFYNIKGNFAGNKGHRSDVFEFDPEPVAGSEHPTPKPVDLMAALIEFFRTDVILDPMMGSGTTLVAAKQCNRQAVGIEIEERFCELAAKRLSQEVLAFAI